MRILGIAFTLVLLMSKKREKTMRNEMNIKNM